MLEPNHALAATRLRHALFTHPRGKAIQPAKLAEQAEVGLFDVLRWAAKYNGGLLRLVHDGQPKIYRLMPSLEEVIDG